MKRYIFYCPNCNQFYSNETDNPNDVPKCESCKKYMKYTGITKEEWDSKQGQEKEELKNSIRSSYENNVDSGNDAILAELRKISHDIHGLYSIVVWLLVLNIIAGLISIFIR